MGSALPAGAVTPARLIGPDLQVRPIEITTLDNNTLSYFDDQRILQATDINQLVQLREINGEMLADTSHMPGVWLTNGQYFAGNWVGPNADGSGLVWQHPRIGNVTVSLEDITRVNWIADTAQSDPRDTPTADTLTLVNGDTLSGFISSLTEKGIAIVPDTGDASVTIPYGRIASMSLSNGRTQVIEPNHQLTLTDGTRVQADRLQISGGLVSCRVFSPGDSPKELQMPVEALSRIDFWAGGLRLIDLTELPMRTTKKAYVFGLPVPLRVSGQSIRMHAPGEVSMELPDGSQRFAATAELDTQDAPAVMADWSDFEVVVSTGGNEPERFRVTGLNPVVRINMPASAPGLKLRLDPGVNGPILDRLRLRDAVILVRTPGSGPTDDNGR